MEEKAQEKNIQVRCSIGFEELEGEGNFCRYNFAVPVEDLQSGYTIGNNNAFRCTIDDELKFVNIIALELSTVAEVEFEGYDEKVLCLVYVFIGMKPMSEDEFKEFNKEMEEQRKQYEASLEEGDVEDAEIIEDYPNDLTPDQPEGSVVLDLTRK